MYRAKKETIIRNKAKEDISEHLQEKGISAEEFMPEAEPGRGLSIHKNQPRKNDRLWA